jgi:hypothetical protein
MMRAISLWQPWASAMAMGIKQIETRSRRFNKVGDLAICSTLQIPDIEPELFKEVKRLKIMESETFQLGAVLCVVEVYGCCEVEKLIQLGKVSEQEKMFGDYSKGRFGWVTKNLRTLKKPISVKGGQGFFFLPPDVEIAVRKQL